ncbi:EamA family transporter RarD [Rhodospirillum sp. A1_3_36]|uniref:EamA family transporter RarD n=1 Tax=Rhodospirillum sp. A1_3_36 TaxID=3391666 RepID=UPI0039A7658F
MSRSPETGTPKESATVGVLSALGAFGIWGVSPLFFNAVSEVPVLEILSQRILWASLVVGLVLAFRGEFKRTLAFLAQRKTAWTMVLSTVLVSANWITFIYAVTSGQALQGSLGYYIFPLVTVLLGRLVLGESMSCRQTLALALAFVGVAVAIEGLGGVPWISLVLAVTFSLYGLVRKMAPVPALSGLFLETLLISPFLLTYLAGMEFFGAGIAFLDGPWPRSLWLMALGPLTAFPLFLFASAARRMRLSTLGILQYTNPTIQFLVATLVFKESLNPATLATFACIWCGVALYLWPDRREKGA